MCSCWWGEWASCPVSVCGRALGGCVAACVGVAWFRARERSCLREICGWVGDVEGVTLLEELFCL